MKRVLSLLAVSGMVLAASACAKSSARTAGEDSATAVGGSANASAPADLTVDETALRSIAMQTVAERPVAQTLTVAGKVQFDEDRLAHVLAPLAGQVVDLRVKVGDAVRKGQPLCAISSRDATAVVGEHTESHKDLELAEKTAAIRVPAT